MLKHHIAAPQQDVDDVEATWVLATATLQSPALHMTYAKARLRLVSAILAHDEAFTAGENLVPTGAAVNQAQHEVTEALAQLIRSV